MRPDSYNYREVGSEYLQGGSVDKGRSSTKLVLLILGGVGVFMFLMCGGVLGLFAYLGMVGPETSVYAGNQVPDRFAKIMKADGALDEGESVRFFYSDALADIHDGYYFVSDQKVVIYDQNSVKPLTKVAFDEIASAEILRGTSFFEDGAITLFLKNGEVISFPVSTEMDRDQMFFDEIQSHLQQ